MSGPNLESYVEVNERIAAFYAKYPNGSLQSEWEIREVGEQLFVVVDAWAYRDPYDPRPGQGTAWEPFPGRTPYTKGSELMVGQTSAWGRAIAALGFKVNRGVASADEIRAAQERRAETNGSTMIDSERAAAIIATFHERRLNYQGIDLMLGAAGIDALRARSKKAAQERVASLTAEQADALEALLAEAKDG